ncbi:MAG: hypothetical protein Q8K68_13765 [Nitrospirota bacterium]|nr:hypothetical protein [Nitrospirota bacterium]
MHTKSNLVVASRVNTKYRDSIAKGYKVSIPVMAEGTDAEVTPGVVPTPSDLAGTPVSITVDQWRVAAAEISDMADIEDPIGYMNFAAENCSYRISKRVDTKLGSLFPALQGSSVYGSDGQVLTDEIILALMQTLDEGDVPEDNRSIIADPSSKVDLLGIDKFVRNDYVREPVIPTGRFGNIYNMGVFITNNLTAATTGNYAAMLHRDAIGLAIQRNPRSQIVRIPQEFRTLIMVDVIYGVGELRDTFGQAFYSHKS